ncbi:UNVERIFIED_CONTAM: hypothetical protein PYX00_011685 [Menopon gallinae]|uniref:Symplekin C-terminal domain-containing protein n=1 Tax=Menopon gallinae TaxID=328185 RepID=A0AAW2H8Y7_9NEOP
MSPEELRIFRSLGCRPAPQPAHCSIDELKDKFMASKCTETFALIRAAINARRDDSLVLRIVDSDYLALVVGEYMLKYKIPADFMLNFPRHIPYIFLAYTTVHSVFLSHFEQAFAKFASFGVLKVLLDANMDQGRLKSAIATCTGRVEGLEESIVRYESFRERGFLQQVAPMISPQYTDLMLSIHSTLSEYSFCLDSSQAYLVLRASIRHGNCLPGFIQYLVTKLEAGHATAYQDAEETLIALHSKYRLLPMHVVSRLADSIEKHYLLTCGEYAPCPRSCVPSLHGCHCETVCSHLLAGARPAERINGFYFSLHDRDYAAHMIEEFLARQAPDDCIQNAVFREQVLCFVRDRELTLAALSMLSSNTFFGKLREIEELLPTHGRKIEALLMHTYNLVVGKDVDKAWDGGTAPSRSVVPGFYLSTFTEYVIYKECAAVLLQIESFDISKHHYKLSTALLEKYFESKDMDDLFIETHFERYREVILRTLLRKRQTVRNYRVLLPYFRGTLREMAFKCAVREELFRITKDPRWAMKAVLAEQDISVVFEYLRGTAEQHGVSGKRRECREILRQFAEKYKHVLQAECCMEEPPCTNIAESACKTPCAGDKKNKDTENMHAHTKAEKRHKDAEESGGRCAKRKAAAAQDALDVFVSVLQGGAVDSRVLEDTAAYMQKHRHGVGFLVSTTIAKSGRVEDMAVVFAALLDRLAPDAQAFYIRNIFSHSREAAFVKKSLRFIEVLLCNLSTIDTEAARMFISNNRHAKNFEFLEHVFQKVDHGNIMKCLQALRRTLRKDMVPYICRGIYANASASLEGERYVSFLRGIAEALSKDNDELVKIAGMRLLTQSLLAEGRNPRSAGDSACDESNGCRSRAGREGQVYTTDFLDGVAELLNSRDEFVVIEALDVLKAAVASSSTLNCKVFDVLHRRAKLDDVGKKCLEVLDINSLQKPHLDRLFQMFYLDPLAFLVVLPKLRAFGYVLDGEMVNELILLLAKTYSDEKRELIYKALSDSVDSSCVDAVLNAVSTNNLRSQLILVSILERITSHVDMKIFLRLCTVIPTDMRLAVRVLRVLESKKRAWAIPDKWMVEKLDMLMVWIYPLQMTDKDYYAQLCTRMELKSPDVYAAARDYHAGRRVE